MGHRIREAMRSGDLSPFGGNGSPVEVDETLELEADESGVEFERAFNKVAPPVRPQKKVNSHREDGSRKD